MTTNACLKPYTYIDYLGTKLKYYPLSVTYLESFLALVCKYDEDSLKAISKSRTTQDLIEVLKNVSVPYLNATSQMMQHILDLCRDDRLYELICVCFPAFRQVERNSVNMSALVVLFFIIWVTYIPVLTNETLKLGEDLSGEELGKVIEEHTTAVFKQGTDSLNKLQK